MRPTRSQYRSELSALEPGELPNYLTANSDLPGPRGNLTLLDAAADLLPRQVALELAACEEEYLACCGVATLGRLILEDPSDRRLVELLTSSCSDQRWRVREACAIAAQRIGNGDPVHLRELVEEWTTNDDPLVIRAGIATICEPRLLREPATASAALAACRRATAFLRDVPASNRRDSDVRTLRQGLGYCWSVAVAASPEIGLPEFLALPTDDPDVAWLVRENRRKKRVARLIPD